MLPPALATASLRGATRRSNPECRSTKLDCFAVARMTCVLFLMSPRLRKFIGTVALLFLVVVWALIAMALAQMPAIRDNAVVSVAYYVIAGLGWCLPAIPIVTWMSRTPRSNS